MKNFAGYHSKEVELVNSWLPVCFPCRRSLLIEYKSVKPCSLVVLSLNFSIASFSFWHTRAIWNHILNPINTSFLKIVYYLTMYVMLIILWLLSVIYYTVGTHQLAPKETKLPLIIFNPKEHLCYWHELYIFLVFSRNDKNGPITRTKNLKRKITKIKKERKGKGKGTYTPRPHPFCTNVMMSRCTGL